MDFDSPCPGNGMSSIFDNQGLMLVLQMVPSVAIFYFLLIRPQPRKAKSSFQTRFHTSCRPVFIP